MPTYEYKCFTCGHEHEVLGKYEEDKTNLYCQPCWIRTEMKAPLQKIISKGQSVHFKGSGFYQTDYKGK